MCTLYLVDIFPDDLQVTTVPAKLQVAPEQVTLFRLAAAAAES
jgi:hypothetical protein